MAAFGGNGDGDGDDDAIGQSVSGVSVQKDNKCERQRGSKRSIHKKLLAVKSKSNDVLRKWLDGNADLMFIVVIVIVVITHSLKDLVNILDYTSYRM